MSELLKSMDAQGHTDSPSFSMSSDTIVDSFRSEYSHLEESVQEALANSSNDPFLIERVGIALGNYTSSLQRVDRLPCFQRQQCALQLSLPLTQFSHLFGNEEAETIRTNTALLGTEIGQAYAIAAEASHRGRPHPVSAVATGRPGRPRLIIDREWLTWAIQIRNTSDIARYLGVSRPVVRDAILENGLREAGEDPFVRTYYNPPAQTSQFH